MPSSDQKAKRLDFLFFKEKRFHLERKASPKILDPLGDRAYFKWEFIAGKLQLESTLSFRRRRRRRRRRRQCAYCQMQPVATNEGLK